MKNKKRSSPFQQLVSEVENALFDLELSIQLNDADKLNLDFVIGYRCALNLVLEKACTIYNRRFPASAVMLDERTAEASEILIAELKKRG